MVEGWGRGPAELSASVVAAKMLWFLGFFLGMRTWRSARPVFARPPRSRLLPGLALATLIAAGCATPAPGGPRLKAEPPSQEAQAAAAFMRAHSLELEGRLVEAAAMILTGFFARISCAQSGIARFGAGAEGHLLGASGDEEPY